MEIIVNYSALKSRKDAIIRAMHKLAEMPELDVNAVNVLTKEFSEISKFEELAMKYGKVQ